jgi:hypothetical protein
MKHIRSLGHGRDFHATDAAFPASGWAAALGPARKRRIFAIGVLVVAVMTCLAALNPAPSSAAHFTGTLPNHFSISSSSISLSTPALGRSISCGEIVGGEGNLTSATGGTFQGELGGCGTTCQSLTGGKVKFEGGLEVVQIEPKVLGVVLTPKEMSWRCETSPSHTYSFRGSVVGTITPVGDGKTFTLGFAESGGFNQYQKCEIGALCSKSLRLEGDKDGGLWEYGALVSSTAVHTTTATNLLR